MRTHQELINEFLTDLMATCPPGYELDTMSIDRAGDPAMVNLLWKPVVSPPGD
jgi:hypothetical protein